MYTINKLEWEKENDCGNIVSGEYFITGGGNTGFILFYPFYTTGEECLSLEEAKERANDHHRSMLLPMLSEVDTYYDLTVQLLNLRNEIYAGAGMDKDCFTETYLNGLGDYEKDVAKKEDIQL